MANDIPSIIFVLGAPGSGKGTLCKRVVDEHARYLHLSVGDYLREICDSKVDAEIENLDVNRIRYHLRENILLPSEILIPLLEHKIKSMLHGRTHSHCLLLDGFPRNEETALVFAEKICDPLMVVVLGCKREIAKQRYLSRGREKADDNERFDKRFNEYEKNMESIEGTYDELIKKEIQVHGSQEDCYREFSAVLPPEPMF
ncbi:P-loop containing nucleoside triphosphate hydrolase protein [Hypomontagnella monticulosa]|nr:P-loop containing nucleoside triphosphate hydrolase protein [Hypomontagnella monticulosa]